MSERLFTLKEASSVTGVKPATFRKWIERSEILPTKFKQQNFFTAQELSLILWAKALPAIADQFDEQYGVTYED
jgi:hypothetical protein